MRPITHFKVKLSHLTQDLVIKTVRVVGMRWLLLAGPGQGRLSLALSRFLWSPVDPSCSHWPAWALTRSRCDPECYNMRNVLNTVTQTVDTIVKHDPNVDL